MTQSLWVLQSWMFAEDERLNRYCVTGADPVRERALENQEFLCHFAQ